MVKRLKIILRVCTFLLFVLVLFGCTTKETAPTETQPSNKISNAEYIVLNMIVDSLYHSPADSVLVLQDSTSSGTYGNNLDSALTNILQYVQQHISALSAETIQDFKSKNLTRTFIQNPLSVHPACVLSSKTQRIYPSISVSRVGFRSDGSQALAYVGNMNAPLAGEGCYFVLSWERGSWIIIGSVLIWIS